MGVVDDGLRVTRFTSHQFDLVVWMPDGHGFLLIEDLPHNVPTRMDLVPEIVDAVDIGVLLSFRDFIERRLGNGNELIELFHLFCCGQMIRDLHHRRPLAVYKKTLFVDLGYIFVVFLRLGYLIGQGHLIRQLLDGGPMSQEFLVDVRRVVSNFSRPVIFKLHFWVEGRHDRFARGRGGALGSGGGIGWTRTLHDKSLLVEWTACV